MKNRKRFLTACLSVAVLVCCVLLMPVEAEAANVVASGECGANRNNVTWVLDDSGVLTISGTGEMTDYLTRFHEPPWYTKKDRITKLVIEQGVTNIGKDAFFGCDKITEVSIPNSVTHIGKSAFQGCEDITEIILPSSVISIDEYAFCDCYNLANINIPNGIDKISNGLFAGCRSLTSINIPSSVKSIGHTAFSSSGLISITIPDGVTRIGLHTFKFCDKLKVIMLPASITRIDSFAFQPRSTYLWHVLYKGTEAQRDEIFMEDKILLSNYTTWHYNCTGEETADPTTLICSVCRANCAHVWDEGNVTKKPTCIEEGSKTYMCILCWTQKSEVVAKSTKHNYNSWTKVDGNNHTHSCSLCKKSETVGHTWDEGKNQTDHSKLFTCTACKATKTEAHKHAYGSDWKSDANNHWHICACGAKADEAAHTWDSGKTNADGSKLFTCTACKATKTEAAPSGGGSSGNGGTTGSGNTDTLGTGDSSGGNNSTDTPTNTPSDTPADDDGKENGGNSTVIIIVAAVAILGGGGAVAGLVLGKKKK